MSNIDKDRYATVYEDKKLQESVAAPTAGLHFDEELLDSIKKQIWCKVCNYKFKCWSWYLSTCKS